MLNEQFVSSGDGSSMSSVENESQAIHRMAVLATLSIQDLILFFYSKEGQVEVKESIVLANEDLRRVAVVGFGRMLLTAWEAASQCDIESIFRFSSSAEARRMGEDFTDFSCEIIKQFSLGVTGKAASVDPLLPMDDNQILFQVEMHCCLVKYIIVFLMAVIITVLCFLDPHSIVKKDGSSF